jgi:hypothetical protein
MALTQVTGPYPIFTDLDGTPLDDGYLYIGAINDDPETNPIQVFFDSNLTIPATQPIRTSNGYAYRNGTPALLYTGGEFSITIRNKRNEFVLYSPVGYGFDPAAVSASVVKNDFIGDGVTVAFVLSASPSTILATNIFINGVYQEKDSYTLSGNTITFLVAPPLSSSIEVLTNETGIINSGNANNISYTYPALGAVLQTVQGRLEHYVSVKDFGAVGDGVTDDTAAIQAAIDAVSSVEFPAGYTFVTSGNTIGSNKTLVINGTVLLKAASPIGAKMFVNDNQVGGNTNIKMLGDGVLDGNKANQTGVTDTVWHTLVDIDNCDYFEFAVAKITGNYFPIAVTAGNTTGAVYIRNSDYVSVHDSLATDYGREAFWCETCNESSMTNLKGVGGTDSWSVVQFSGNRNIASNIYANNAGAAGASFDITNSTISNVVNYNNRFQNGVNFGHSGIPASYSTATNIVSINAAIGSTNAGIQVAASTVGFVLDGFQVSGSAGPGVRVSDGSDNIRISGGISTGNTGFGLVLFTAAATDLPRFYVSNVDLRGNTAGDYSRSGGTVAELFRNVRLSDDPMVGFQAINGLGIGGTVTVTNGNVVSTSVITANASNLAGANAVPLVQSIVDGSFVIQTVNSGGGGAGLRYYIS